MTIEEKAKAYDKALSKAREYHFQGQDPDKLAELESIFPVLKESEDERIRKALLRCCDDWDKGQFGCMKKEDVPSIRAYLEKQKEQKPNIKYIYPKFRVGDVIEPVKPNGSYIPVRVRYIGDGGYSCESDDRRAFLSFPICRENEYILTDQKLAEWSDVDEDMFNAICYCASTKLPFQPEHLTWLNNRVKRLHPQPHWKPSEQEKCALRTAIHVLTEERNFPKAAEHLQAILDAFDKETRKEWKPNEEQMEALKWLVEYVVPSEKYIVLIKNLYDDLKKLM